jgi:hypothetical protein
MWYYYCCQTAGSAVVPRLVHVGDILVVKIDDSSGIASVMDMTKEDVSWIKENLGSVL